MTLTEAREILSGNKVREALELLISVLPAEPTRESALERAKELRTMIKDAKGFDPFAVKFKDRELVVWRNCVFYQLRKEGYTFGEIGRATGYNHSSIIHAYQTLGGYLEMGDRIATDIWKEYLGITQADGS